MRAHDAPAAPAGVLMALSPSVAPRTSPLSAALRAGIWRLSGAWPAGGLSRHRFYTAGPLVLPAPGSGRAQRPRGAGRRDARHAGRAGDLQPAAGAPVPPPGVATC